MVVSIFVPLSLHCIPCTYPYLLFVVSPNPDAPPPYPTLGTECTIESATQLLQSFQGGRVHIPIVIRSILPVPVGSGDSASRFTGVMPLVIFIYLIHPHSMYPYI